MLLLLTLGVSGWAVWEQREQRHDAELREAEHRERARAAGELERLENERRIDLEAWSLLVRARKRLAIPTAGRRDEVANLLRESTKLRRRLPAGEAAERLDLETRSIFAASLGVPELRTEPCRTPLPRVFTAAWRAAIHPDGNSIVVGTHLGPVRWTRGQPFVAPDGLDEKKPRPRLAYHPDGNVLAFAPSDGGLQIWDETATRKLADLDPSSGIEFLDFAFTAKSVWACRADGAVLSWSLPGWTDPVERKLDTGTITAARFNDDASLVAVGASDGTVHWCRTEEGKSLRQMATGRFGIDALAWSSDGSHIAVGTRNGDVQVWTRDGQLRREIPTTESGIGALHFHRNGQWLLAGGRAGAMYMWNAHTGEPLLNGPDIPWCFSRDGARLAGGNAEGVSFIDLAPPTVVKQLSGHRSFIEQFAWSRDGRVLATLDRQFELRIWDLETGTSTTRFTVALSPYAVSNAALALSTDGAFVAYASSGEKGALEIFDVAKGERVASHPLSDGFGRLGHDGTRFVFVREERSGKALRTVACSFAPDEEALDWHELRPLVPNEILFHSSILTPDGRYYLWAGPRTPSTRMRVELFDVAKRKRVRRIDCPYETALQSWGSAISADGRLIWVADRLPGYARYDTFDNERPTHVLFAEHASPDRKWFAAAGVADARLGKIPVQQLRTSPDGPARFQFTNGDLDGMGTASFSPDGRYVLWVGPGYNVTVVDLPALSRKVEEYERALAE